MKQTAAPNIIFVTGTDTGVGKTLLTGLLLHHLRRSGCRAFALKPFCSGSRGDAQFLRALQDGELSLDEINPYFYKAPLAPLVASRRRAASARLAEVLRHIRSVASRCERLLVEGIGGVLVPLGENFCVLDLIARLDCAVIVVSRNRVGTINHTLLTTHALKRAGVKRLKVVMMSSHRADKSAASNRSMLAELLDPIPVIPLPFLGRNPARSEALKGCEKKVRKRLALICA
jgi:dethiobiotin synthetase